MRERVLITGGTGFIGARLARRLLDAGDEVTLLRRSPVNSERLRDLDGFTIHSGDLRDRSTVREAIRSSRADVVYHLAAEGVRGGECWNLVQTNVLATAAILEAVREQGCRTLVCTGSGAEYGPADHALTEDAPLRPQSDYARTKAEASFLCQEAASRSLPVVLVRIFAAYGPGEASEGLIPQVMGCCLRGQAPRLAAGNQQRDFVHVDDVVSLLEMAGREPRAAGRVLHAATGRAAAVRTMVETILDVAGMRHLTPDFGARPTHPDEPPLCLASIEQTRTLTGWQPRFDLRAGVRQTWDWFHEAHGAGTPRRAGRTG